MDEVEEILTQVTDALKVTRKQLQEGLCLGHLIGDSRPLEYHIGRSVGLNEAIATIYETYKAALKKAAEELKGDNDEEK